MLILNNQVLVREVQNISFAESLIKSFVWEFQKMYGRRNVSFNIHNLLHLAKDVQNFGFVESFSAFPFENYICSIKNLIRKGERPLQQIVRRLKEYESVKTVKSSFTTNDFEVDKITYSGININIDKSKSYYKVLITKSYRLDTSDERNNCVVLSDGTVVNVLNVFETRDGCIYISGNKCHVKKICL